MKKRILSIALAVVMVVAAISTTILTVSATWLDILCYDVIYTNKEVAVDAQLDEVYKKGEIMESHAESWNSYGDKSAFVSYTVVTDDGIYVWAQIKDYTIGSEYMEFNTNRGNVNDVGNHDKFEYYYTTTYKDGTSWWGYFELDYYANNVDGEEFENVNSTSDKVMHHTRYKKNVGGKNTEINDAASVGIEYATKILRDDGGNEYAWVAEFFLPWDTAGVMTEEAGAAPYAVSVGLQANNDDWVYNEEKGGKLARQGYCYSTHTSSSYYNGPSSSAFIALNYITEEKVYDIYTTNKIITLDGVKDDLYANAASITNNYNWNKDTPNANFEAKTVATLNGFYTFIHVDDTTMNNAGDGNPHTGEKVAIHFDMTPYGVSYGKHLKDDNSYGYNRQYTSIAGWYEFDYEGNKANYIQNSGNAFYLNGVDFKVVKIVNPDWDGVDATTQYIGYDMEIFIPFTPDLKAAIATQKTEGYNFRYGIEVHDDQAYNGKEERTQIACDHADTMNAWSTSAVLNRVNFKYDAQMFGGAPIRYVAYTSKAPTLDGTNTAGEYNNAQVIHVNLHGDGTGDDEDIYRVITDGNYIYILMENYDTTPSTSASQQGSYVDYIDFMFAIGNRLGGYTSFRRDGTGGGGYNHGNQSMGSDIFNKTNGCSDWRVIDNGTEGYTVELMIKLTDDEKALLEAGKLTIGHYAQYHDGHASGRNYKYDWDDSRVAGWYSQNDKIGFYANTSVVLNREFTQTKFTGAQVALGDSINVNFYANLSVEIANAVVKFTYNNGDVFYVDPQKTDKVDQYVFTFENINPQCMGDVLTAELIANGNVVDTVDYSVLMNCENLLDAGVSAEAEQLIYDLLAYGAAAQRFKNYKTDTLVDAGYESMASQWETYIEDIMTDKTVDGAVDGARFSAAGVRYTNVNKLFAKVTVTTADAAALTVTINGEAAELIALDNGEYIVYSDAISVVDFDEVYTFAITDGATTQTLTYSVNSYAAAKASYEETDLNGYLAFMLYCYGVSAEAYAG